MAFTGGNAQVIAGTVLAAGAITVLIRMLVAAPRSLRSSPSPLPKEQQIVTKEKPTKLVVTVTKCNGESLALEMNSEQSVQVLKQEISTRAGLPQFCQQLFLIGDVRETEDLELRNNETLSQLLRFNEAGTLQIAVVVDMSRLVRFIEGGRNAAISDQGRRVVIWDKATVRIGEVPLISTEETEVNLRLVKWGGTDSFVGVCSRNHCLNSVPNKEGVWGLDSDGFMHTAGIVVPQHHPRFNRNNVDVRLKFVPALYSGKGARLDWWVDGKRQQPVEAVDPGDDGMYFCVGRGERAGNGDGSALQFRVVGVAIGDGG
jgi:hypothetical protein